MPAATYIRQSSIINIKKFSPNTIGIVGCGAVGSFVAISLAKMGLINFHLFDFDKVAEHNLPNQFFIESDVGEYKANATSINMDKFNSDIYVCSHLKKIRANTIMKFNQEIVVCCVDKMAVRKIVFEKAIKDKKCQLFIDTRMGGLQGQVYTVDMGNVKARKEYRKSLFKDKDAVQLRCTERSIIFTVMGIAALVCNQIVKAFKEEKLINYMVLDYTVPQMF